MKSNDSRLINICLIILTMVATTVALIYTKTILIPFVIAIFLYYALLPAMRFLHTKCRIPVGLSKLLACLIGTGVIVLLTIVLVDSVQQFLNSLDTYSGSFRKIVAALNKYALYFDIDLNHLLSFQTISELPVIDILRKLSKNVLTFVSNTALVVIFLIFLLIGKQNVDVEKGILGEVENKVSSYISAKLFLSGLTATFVGAVFFLLGAKLAMTFALVTFVFNFIPNIGSIIAMLIPIPVLALQFGFGWPFWVGIIVPAVIQFYVGNILEPKMMGNTIGQHPITILIMLMFWGLVWGIPGMFIAVPIASFVQIILSRLPQTKGLADLMEGKISSSED